MSSPLDATARAALDELAHNARRMSTGLRMIADNMRAEGLGGSRPDVLDEASDVILALLAAVERGAEDTERLDAVRAFAFSIHCNYTAGDEAWTVTDHGTDGLGQTCYDGATPREAIDKAVAEEPAMARLIHWLAFPFGVPNDAR